MKLSDHDLLQLDEEYLTSLGSDALLAVSRKLLSDLKESRERLNLTPDNSSQPPSSRSPYLGVPEVDEEETEEVSGKDDSSEGKKGKSGDGEDFRKDDDGPGKSASGRGQGSKKRKGKRKAGKQPGAPGGGRQQKIPVQREEAHKPKRCAACDEEFPLGSLFTARIGYLVLDLIKGDAAHPGLQLVCTKHLFGEVTCRCGHVTRTAPMTGERHVVEGRQEATCLSEWRLVGPMLAAFIVALALRMRLSRCRIREFLNDWFGLELSTGTIDRCIREAGLAADPLHDELIDEARRSGLIHVDETPWKEKGVPRWLWVFVTAHTVLFLVGQRTRQVVIDILTESYAGWLMSDGLMNYRVFQKRLRCLAHLIRKARGLAESLDKETREFGTRALEVLEFVVEQARDGPVPAIWRPILSDFRQVCEYHRKWAPAEKARRLAVEFLNDWDVIWLVLEEPDLPLTNNEAERALRHWVIARRISHGSRTAEGSRVISVLASVIETCRKRNRSPWDYLATVIAERRKGNSAPPLPAPVAA